MPIPDNSTLNGSYVNGTNEAFNESDSFNWTEHSLNRGEFLNLLSWLVTTEALFEVRPL